MTAARRRSHHQSNTKHQPTTIMDNYDCIYEIVKRIDSVEGNIKWAQAFPQMKNLTNIFWQSIKKIIYTNKQTEENINQRINDGLIVVYNKDKFKCIIKKCAKHLQSLKITHPCNISRMIDNNKFSTLKAFEFTIDANLLDGNTIKRMLYKLKNLTMLEDLNLTIEGYPDKIVCISLGNINNVKSLRICTESTAMLYLNNVSFVVCFFLHVRDKKKFFFCFSIGVQIILWREYIYVELVYFHRQHQQSPTKCQISTISMLVIYQSLPISCLKKCTRSPSNSHHRIMSTLFH